ncbi:MAG: hypothetical protein K0S91_281 [Nitrososphaeraceae archaeon]|jgi:hypothetical protein|nr:hypothetical protein [Nitrososphaeraceae archaeon]
MKIECRDCWAEINILEEDIVADGILSYPDNGADFVIRSTITITTTTKDKVKSRLAKNVDKDREQ